MEMLSRQIDNRFGAQKTFLTRDKGLRFLSIWGIIEAVEDAVNYRACQVRLERSTFSTFISFTSPPELSRPI